MRCFAVALVLVAATVLDGAARAATDPAGEGQAAPPPAPSPHVEFVDGRLSVDATDVPMMDLLGQIADATGAKVAGRVEDPGSVTVSFDDVPVRQAIDRIVGERNFTLRYGSDGSLRRITLRGRSLDAPGPVPAQPPRARARFQRLWARQPAVSVSEQLAQALGARTISLPRLLRSVRRLEGRPLRRQAIARFMTVVEDDNGLRTAWRGMSPSDLARFMKLQTGNHARESLVFVAASTKNAKARLNVGAAIRLLPTTRVGTR